MPFVDVRLFHLVFAALLLMASAIASDAHAYKQRGYGGNYGWSPKHAGQQKSFSRSRSNLPGWYMGLSTSVNFVADSSLSEQGGTSLTGTLSFDEGYGVAGAMGYSFADLSSNVGRLRLEFEVGVRNNKLESVTPTGGTTTSLIDDDAMLQTTMANLYFDFDTRSPWRPYLGLGVGMGRLSIDSTTLNIDETEPLFAYQGMAGIYYQPASFKNVGIGIGYRYLATADGDFETTIGSKMDVEYSSHLIEFGTQIRF